MRAGKCTNGDGWSHGFGRARPDPARARQALPRNRRSSARGAADCLRRVARQYEVSARDDGDFCPDPRRRSGGAVMNARGRLAPGRTYLGEGLAFPFRVTAHGRIATARAEAKIEQAVWLILSTATGERVMRPTHGCG